MQLQNASSSSALLQAVRIGDLNEVKRLLAQGQKVNQTDLFGTTALHLAAMYDHLDIIELLVQKGAKLNSTTYQEYYDYAYTPLDLAVKYGANIETVNLLVNKGGASNHLNDLVFDLFDTILETSFKQDYSAFDLALNKIETLALNISEAKVVDDGYEAIPITILAQVYNSEGISDPQYFQRMLQTTQLLLEKDADGLTNKYILAKNVLHAFPSDYVYAFSVGDSFLVVEAEGHFTRYTVACAHAALSDFTDTLVQHVDAKAYQSLSKIYHNEPILASIDAYTAAMKSTFANVTYAFETAAKTVQMGWQHEVSENLYQDYLAGKTILLPTGWMGHAIDIIIDKTYDLLMVANSGDRNENLPGGLNAYHLNFDLTVDDIYSILTNDDKMNLEFKSFYDWGLTEYPEFSFSIADQEYGNCAWYSQTIAEQALIFLDLKKSVVSNDCAIDLSEKWFDDLNDFQQTKILKDYLADPALEVDAMGDILVNYHYRLKNPGEIERAHMILDAMQTPENKADFAAYCKDHQLDFSKELKSLIKTYGFKVKGDFDFGTGTDDVLTLDDVLGDQEELLFRGDASNNIVQSVPQIIDAEPVVWLNQAELVVGLELPL